MSCLACAAAVALVQMQPSPEPMTRAAEESLIWLSGCVAGVYMISRQIPPSQTFCPEHAEAYLQIARELETRVPQ